MAGHTTSMTGYDIIGDVHGHADRLVALLEAMNYRKVDGVWRHPERTAVFVGDLVDRGKQQLDSVNIVRSMIEADTAKCVMGNHEFNAIAYVTFDPARGDHCRSRLGWKGDKHARQHRDFIGDVGLDTPVHHELTDWFRTIPMWLELTIDAARLRVVHACWHQPSVDLLAGHLDASDGVLTDELVIEATTPGTVAHDAIEIVLKGPEVHLGGRTYQDKNGVRRSDARLRWWDTTANTLRQAALIPGDAIEPDGTDFTPLPDIPTPSMGPSSDATPVIFGHYWFSGTPTPTSDTTACVDFSVGSGGPLVAYRWSGEETLTAANFVSV